MNEKNYKKSLELISFDPPSYQYYDRYPVQPGIPFYRALVSSKVPCSQLKMLIPHTVGLFDEKFQLFTHLEKGHLVYS